MQRQRGFTLIETAIVVAGLALLVTAAAFAFAKKPYALRSSAMQFDGILAHARSLAETSGNGATLVAVPRADRTMLYLYRGRPNDPASVALDGPPVELEASADAASLGDPPYAFFIDGSGQTRAIAAYPPLQDGVPGALPPLAAPPPCSPPGYALTLSAPGASEGRLLPCAAPIEGPPDTVPSP